MPEFSVRLQAALQEAHDQNERLRLTVSAMRTDMESLQHHTTGPTDPTHLPASSTPLTSPHQQPHSSMPSQLLSQLQHQSYQQLPQQMPVVTGAGTNPGNHQLSASQAASHASLQQRQQEEVQSLCKQLQDAKCEAQDLAAENERLMELSNALRSERDRAGLVQNSPGMYPQQRQLTAVANAGGSQGSAQPAPAMQPPAPMAEAHAQYAVQQAALGYQQVPQPQVLQHYMVQQPYQVMPQMAQNAVSGQGQGSLTQPHMQGSSKQPHGAESWQNVVQQPAGQSTMPQGQQQSKGPVQPGADDCLPSEVMIACVCTQHAMVLISVVPIAWLLSFLCMVLACGLYCATIAFPFLCRNHSHDDQCFSAGQFSFCYCR